MWSHTGQLGVGPLQLLFCTLLLANGLSSALIVYNSTSPALVPEEDNVRVDTACVQRSLSAIASSCDDLDATTSYLYSINANGTRTRGDSRSVRVALSSMIHACVQFGEADRSVRRLRVLAGTARLYPVLQRLGSQFSAATGIPLFFNYTFALGASASTMRAAMLAPPPITDTEDESGGVDAIITSPSYMPLMDQGGKLMDITQLVESDLNLRWSEIGNMLRSQMVVYGNKVVAIPVASSPFLLFYHAPIFQRDGLEVPVTWDQVLALGERYTGQDLNGDGVPDYSICLPPPNCFIDGALLRWVFASYVQTHGPTHGVFYDPATMANLANTSALAEALYVLRRLRLIAGQPPGDCTIYEDAVYLRGRCLLSVTGHATFKAAFAADAPAAYSTMRGRMGIAPFPGSTRVLDRPTGQMVDCDETTCPLARFQTRDANGVLRPVNQPVPSNSIIVMINAQSPPKYQFYAYSLFSYLTSPQVLGSEGDALLLDPRLETTPMRSTDLTPQAAALWVTRGYHPSDVHQFFAAFRESLENPNQSYEPRFPGSLDIGSACAVAATLYVNATPGFQPPPVSVPVSVISQKIAAVLLLHGGPDAFAPLYRQTLNWVASSPPPPPPISGVSGGDKRKRTLTIVAAVLPSALVLVLGLAVALAGLRRRCLRCRMQRAVKAPGAGLDTTLLVTDIQSSTSLWEYLDAGVMDQAISVHHAVMRTAIADWGGYESATEGDSFIVAFWSPTDALACALAAQQALLSAPWPPGLLAAPPLPGLEGDEQPLAELAALPTSRQPRGPGRPQLSGVSGGPRAQHSTHHEASPRPGTGALALRAAVPATSEAPGASRCRAGCSAALARVLPAWCVAASADAPVASSDGAWGTLAPSDLAAHVGPGGSLRSQPAAALSLDGRPSSQHLANGAHESTGWVWRLGPSDSALVLTPGPPAEVRPATYQLQQRSPRQEPRQRLVQQESGAALAQGSGTCDAASPSVSRQSEIRALQAPEASWVPARLSHPESITASEGHGTTAESPFSVHSWSGAFAGKLLAGEGQVGAAVTATTLTLAASMRASVRIFGGASALPEAQPSPQPAVLSSVQPTVTSPFTTAAVSKAGRQAAPADAVVLFRGLRVRMGMWTGVGCPSEVSENAASCRTQYSGDCLRYAKAVADTAHGGMVVLTEASRGRLDPIAIRSSKHVLLYGGLHEVAVSGRGDGLGHPQLHIYMAYSAQLLPRCLVVRPLRSEVELRPGVLAAPVGHGAVVQLRIVGTEALLAWDADVAAAAFMQLHSTALQLLSAPALGRGKDHHRGQEGRAYVAAGHATLLPSADCRAPRSGAPGPGPGCMTVVFSDAECGVSWAAAVRRAGLELSWPPQLLEQELAEEVWAYAPGNAGFGGGALFAGQLVPHGPQVVTPDPSVTSAPGSAPTPTPPHAGMRGLFLPGSSKMLSGLTRGRRSGLRHGGSWGWSPGASSDRASWNGILSAGHRAGSGALRAGGEASRLRLRSGAVAEPEGDASTETRTVEASPALPFPEEAEPHSTPGSTAPAQVDDAATAQGVSAAALLVLPVLGHGPRLVSGSSLVRVASAFQQAAQTALPDKASAGSSVHDKQRHADVAAGDGTPDMPRAAIPATAAAAAPVPTNGALRLSSSPLPLAALLPSSLVFVPRVLAPARLPPAAGPGHASSPPGHGHGRLPLPSCPEQALQPRLAASVSLPPPFHRVSSDRMPFQRVGTEASTASGDWEPQEAKAASSIGGASGDVPVAADNGGAEMSVQGPELPDAHTALRLLYRGLRLRFGVAAGPLKGGLAAGDVSGQVSYGGKAALAAAKLAAKAKAGQICATPDLVRTLPAGLASELMVVQKV